MSTSSCFNQCLTNSLPWWVGASIIGAIVAYLLGITFVIGTLGIVFSPGIVAALVALASIFILGFLVQIGICSVKCGKANA